MRKILCIVGTRPEAIKMAPVILALQKESWAKVRVLATAQHRHLLDQALDFFGITADIDLDIMQPSQSLASLTSRLLLALDGVLKEEQPDIILAQGDTTTVMTAALAAFYHHIPFGHVEAGLRTHDLRNPFPEEANRLLAGHLARWHFAPTEKARKNLLREGIADSQIMVTGNTVIDALLMTSKKQLDIGIDLPTDKRLVLVTSHRRENFGEPIRNICHALKTLAERNPDIQILYPVHPNPNVRNVAHEILGDVENIRLCEPLDYAPFVAAMQRAYIIISDSGGVQEEAPALGKPVLVLRDETERPEAVEQGVVKLVGSHIDTILNTAQKLLDDPAAYSSMARGISPYGDGRSAERIVNILKGYTPPRLIYLSPLPWESFAQRPQKFAQWYHEQSGGEILWIDPYPTRLPNLADFKKLGKTQDKLTPLPPWLKVVTPKALPIEPLPGSGQIHKLLWKPVFNAVEEFLQSGECIIGFGKPSKLALQLLKRHPGVPSFYDAMDDFPAFYSGFSSLMMASVEKKLAAAVSHLLVSSTHLQDRLIRYNPTTTLVLNGCSPETLPPVNDVLLQPKPEKVIGYVGTIAQWFDWDLIIRIAKAKPELCIRLIGPVHTAVPAKLPANIEMLPACPHYAAIKAMAEFSIALIPFKRTPLTRSVDPIKYYEYKALGVPIISTRFGEMAERGNEAGVTLVDEHTDLSAAIDSALIYQPEKHALEQFRQQTSWAARFALAGVLD